MEKQTVVLVGMRASGKSTIGGALTKVLGYSRCIDLDIELEKQQGCSITKIIEQHDWSGFRTLEAKLLEETVEKYPKDTVISTGGGVIETPSAREVLKKLKWVVQILRPIENIIDYLETKEQKKAAEQAASTSGENEMEKERRPAFKRTIAETYEARKDLYFQVSTKDLYWIVAQDRLNIDQFLRNQVQRWSSPSLPRLFTTQREPEPGLQNAIIPRLLHVDLSQFGATYAGKVVSGATEQTFALGFDAVLLLDTDVLSYLGVQTGSDAACSLATDKKIAILKLLRDLRAACPVPIVFSVSEVNAMSIQLVETMARAAIEYLIVDDTSVPAGDSYLEQLAECAKASPATVLVFKNRDTCLLLNECDEQLVTTPKSAQVLQNMKPLIEKAKSHGRRYYLFGSPIQASPSPTLHNTGFELLQQKKMSVGSVVPRSVANITLVASTSRLFDQLSDTEVEQLVQNFDHRRERNYYLCQTTDEKMLRYAANQPQFYGGSVTIPLKEKVAQFMASSSDSATAIGAINTIIRDPTTKLLHGDNTDWMGLHALVRAAFPAGDLSSKKGLVIGAGGTSLAACYCLQHQCRMQVFVYNRTEAKAKSVCDKFGTQLLTRLDNVSQHVDIVISTVPATSQFTLPEAIISQKPVIIDAAYKPRETALVKQAESHGCRVFVGVEMLIGQGLEQYKRWTEQTTDAVEGAKPAIEQAVYTFYNS